MWLSATIIILAVELALLTGFIIGRTKRRNLNKTLLFLGLTFAVTFSLHVIPYLYGLVECKDDSNLVLGLLGSFHAGIELFVGKPAPDKVAAFAKVYPLFSYAYLIGAGMAVLATVSAAVRNRFFMVHPPFHSSSLLYFL